MKMHPKACAVFRQLKDCAREKHPITYGELGKLVGMSHRRVGAPLFDIQDACAELGVPAITALVVLSTTRLPSIGFKGFRGQNLRVEHQAILDDIYAFDWTPITSRVLSDAWENFQQPDG